jgi:hypothetical protein
VLPGSAKSVREFSPSVARVSLTACFESRHSEPPAGRGISRAPFQTEFTTTSDFSPVQNPRPRLFCLIV